MGSDLSEFLGRNLDHLSSMPWGAARTIARIGSLAQSYPEGDALGAEQRGDLEVALARVRSARSAVPDDERALVVESMLLGKLGRGPEAIELGRAAHQARPTWASATALANALRRHGDLDGACGMFWEASRLDDKDDTALLEVGDIELRRERWDDSLRAYEAALARVPRHPWALPSSYFCRYKLTGDESWLSRLRRVASRHPDECGVAGALQSMFGGYTGDDAIARAKDLLSHL